MLVEAATGGLRDTAVAEHVGNAGQVASHSSQICLQISELILGLRPANERCPYMVTPSLIGWAQI